MRICFLEGDMSRSGGTEKMTTWLANALSGTHNVHILSLRLSGEVFFPLHEKVQHQVLPAFSGKLDIFRQIRAIHRYIKENRIDWVINVDVGMGFYGILAARGTAARAVTWEHGNFYNNWGSRLFPYMRRFAARRSDALVVLTQRDRENYEKNIRGCAPVHVIHNPMSMGEYRYDSTSSTILSVGHLLENKGYHRALEIAAQLLPQRPDWQWVICGEGPERPHLEKLIREKGLEGRVLLPGLTKDMDAMYQKAALLVMTSEMEGLPMVLLEGKAHGLPLAAFDIMTGPAEIIRHGVNGVLVPPFDTETMTCRLAELLDDDALRAELSKNAALDAEQFAEENIVALWEKVLSV